MQLTLDLPEEIAEALHGQWRDVPRHALEALATEGYRTGALSESQVQKLLKLDTRFGVHALLKEHRIPYRYSAFDVEQDIAVHRELGLLAGQ